MDFDNLRKRAEALIQQGQLPEDSFSEVSRLLHEIQVYQHELEIQNEELRQTQQDLEQSRQKYLDLYEFAPIGYFSFNPHGLVLEVNLTGAQLLGRERQRLIGKPFTAYLVEEGSRFFFAHLQEVLKDFEIHHCELVLGGGPGKRRKVYVQLESQQVFDEMRNEFVVRSALVDVTVRKEAQQALLEQEIQFQSVVDVMADGVIIIDDVGTIEMLNRAAEQIFGYQSHELVGRNINTLMAEPDRSLHQRYVTHFLHTKHTKIIGVGREVVGIRKDKSSLFLDLAVNVLESGHKTRFTGVVRDITQRKLTEAALREAHRQLTQAYDETLVGWAKALELRDKETEGHTQRVAKLAVELGRFMGLSEMALTHLRWGALLHDIGKIGVPDYILLKPGPLTNIERHLMQQHPVYAYQMLQPIAYLAPALDIPHYHHERWDGSGYPEGLKEQAIPLHARIFAVVDVWDALTNDRPYRSAWTPAAALAYIDQMAGIEFEPQIVEAFKYILRYYG